jgi:hypothetical protein
MLKEDFVARYEHDYPRVARCAAIAPLPQRSRKSVSITIFQIYRSQDLLYTRKPIRM